MRFIEVDGLGAYLHRTLEDDDALANLVCDIASGVVSDFIDQNVDEQSDTVKLDGDGCSDALFLPAHPVSSITTITFDAGLVTEEELDPEEYELGEAGIVYRLKDGSPFAWPLGRRNITVEYVSGHEELPATVTGVAMQVAARAYEVGMMQSETVGSWSGTYVQGGAALTDYEKDILAHWRLAV